ncbi:MAG: hypothetical protein GWN84_23960 [Gammaproteobacteria bacterium]|nr:hypothetical protein [Gammaproteobacteria bacterium]NIR85638.1 hypothetical protein [Gammaproteobacteria bacterium]NIR90126.1 hypothetical protein [Gammaproteobacteria bacterium]NIU06772.1 hypothetical protein [Gammaproteobacteria bacterium]NIV53705.1 hypothetical protein [Gammaproteobacteria bacterium]
MAADARTQPLLETLRERRDTRCRELLANARSEAANRVRRARREGRERLHDAIVDERRRAEQTIRAAEARLETVTRQREQAHAARLVEAGWDLLIEALRARWAQTEARRRWCEALLGQALDTLGHSPSQWRIEHPSDWASAEVRGLLETVEERTGREPVLSPDRDLVAGLRVHAVGVCIDGSVEGLLADGFRIQAELLAEYARCGGEEAPAGAGESRDDES